jgi:hypothetical protein
MNIVSYKIKWLVNIDQPYLHSEYKIIFKGRDENTIKKIKESMNNVFLHDRSASTFIHQAAQGILILKDKNGKTEQIDISDIGFL